MKYLEISQWLDTLYLKEYALLLLDGLAFGFVVGLVITRLPYF